VFAEDARKPGQVERLRLLNPRREVTDTFDCSQPIQLEMIFRVRRPVAGLYCWADLTKTDGVLVWMSDSFDTKPNPLETLSPGVHHLTVTIPAYSVGPGNYVLTLNFTGFSGSAEPVDNLANVCSLRLEDVTTVRGNQRPGFLCAPAQWTVAPMTAPTEVRP
jgi:hypothetical protein